MCKNFVICELKEARLVYAIFLVISRPQGILYDFHPTPVPNISYIWSHLLKVI